MLTGPGQLSFACRNCGFDGLYQTNELYSFQATEDYQSHKDLRVQASGSPRQPLLPKHAGAKLTFGIGSLEQRPECAKVIARVVTYWTYVETQLARLLAQILKANTEPAIAMFLSLRNARAKAEAMEAAASLTLSSDDYELFSALMRYKTSLEKERNDLAHGVFGFSASLPNAIAWTTTTSYSAHQSQVLGLGLTPELHNDFLQTVSVYKIGDIETIAVDVENLELQVGFFTGYLAADDPAWRATRYRQLCAEPRLARELSQIHAAKNNG